MSYTFNVSYKSVSKKVSCPRSATVNDLILASFQKFNVETSQNGLLTYSGKKLDGLLPVRLSNLVNNAKLELSVSAGNSVVTLKVVAAIGDESITKIIKVASSSTLAELVDEFRNKTEIDSDWSDKRIQLSVLQAIKDNLTSDFAQIRVATVIGSATNAVMRLLVEKKDAQQKREMLQEEQRVLRQQLEEKRREERLLKKEEEEMQVDDKSVLEEKDVEMEDSEETENAEVESCGKFKAVETKTGLASGGNDIGHSAKSTGDSGDNSRESTQFSGAAGLSDQPSDHFELVEEREDTLYVPNTRTAIYENPDEDYTVTINQAERYYKMIKSMQGGPKITKEISKPQKYVVRIRFPDRSLLDLPIDDPTIKLGQLLKKIDGYVAEKFINTYKLKNGLPPFKEIVMGFSENNMALNDHPDFQLEKILLIWEPVVSNSKGPYLKEGIATKDASLLPTVQLETHRGELEKGEVTAPKPVIKRDEKKKLSGVPKWFRK